MPQLVYVLMVLASNAVSQTIGNMSCNWGMLAKLLREFSLLLTLVFQKAFNYDG